MGNFIKRLTRKFFLHKFAAAFTAVCIVFMCVPFATLEVSAAETYSGKVRLLIDSSTEYDSHGKTITLKQNESIMYTGTGTDFEVAFTGVVAGEYDIYTDGTDTGETVTVSSDGWEAIVNYWTVIFNYCNDTDTYTSQIVLNGQTATLPNPLPTLNDVDCTGWRSDHPETGDVVDATAAITEPRTFYAYWGAAPARSATINDITISGNVNAALHSQRATITLTGDTISEDYMQAAAEHGSNGFEAPTWITDCPAGLTPNVSYNADDNTTIYLYFTGAPQATNTGTFTVTIPGTFLTSGQPITVTPNSNAKFGIGAAINDPASATISNLTISGYKNTQLNEQTATITLANTKARYSYSDLNCASWFSSLPTGVEVKADLTAGSNLIEITFYGTPSVASTANFGSSGITITIPLYQYLTRDISGSVTANENLRFSISDSAPASDDTNSDGYSDADVAAITSLNLPGFSTTPSEWTTDKSDTGTAIVVWDSSTPMRITALDLVDETLSGTFSLTASGTGLSELERLNVSWNSSLTSVTVSGFSKLKYLYLNDCDLSTVTLTNLTAVRALDVGFNYNLTTLDLSDLTNLQALQIDYTDLTAIDLSNNTELLSLYADDSSSLATINLTGLTKLGAIQARNCNLSSLDVSDCTDLGKAVSGIGNGYGGNSFDGNGMLAVSSNHLISLDLSELSYLTSSNTTLLGQTIDLTLTGSDNSYTGSIDLGESATVTGTGISYSDGTLSSTNSSTTSATFSGVTTGLAGVTLSGTLNLTYPAPPASNVATISAYSLGGVATGSLGTPNSLYSNAAAGAVTLTSTQATSAAFSATPATGATLKYAYTSTDTDPTSSFNSIWTNTTIANGGYVWIEVTAQDTSTKLIYKIAVTVTAAPTAVTFSTLTANGTQGSVDTTRLEIGLSSSEISLSAADITVTGATKGNLESLGAGIYWLYISNITVNNGQTVTVELAKDGYSFSPASKTVAIAKDTRITVSLTVSQTGGTSGTANTTGILLTFGQAVPEPQSISIAGDTGSVTRGSIVGTGTSTTWTIPITAVTTEGNIRVTVNDIAGYKVADNPYNVTVYKATPPTVTNVSVSPSTTSVALGGTQQFTATVSVTSGAAQTVNWSVSGASAVHSGTTITLGGLLTVSADETNTSLTVTATSTVDGTKTGTATVTVGAAAPTTYPVTINGTLLNNYTENATVYITATDPNPGYRFNGWTVTSANTTLLDATALSTSFTMPAGAVTLTTDYTAITYNVYVTGGTASHVSGIIGTTITVTADIPSGQEFVSWTVSGIPSLSGTPATFTMPASDVYITANFQNAYTPPYNPPSTPSYPSYTPSYTPPAPAPTPAPPAPEPNPYVLPSMDVTETPEGTEFTTASGVTSTVQETPEGVKVEAGVNELGSINSQATAAAVSEAAQIARENGETSVTIQIPEGATGLSKNTVQKLVEAADGLEITLELTAVVDGEVVGGVTLPLTSETGQILTGLHFDTKRTEQIENYVSNKWDTDVLGSFETAQKGGWGATATLSIGLEKLGFSADDGTKLYALIYDTKAKKWYQAAAEVVDGEVVIKTKRTGIVTIVTDSVK